MAGLVNIIGVNLVLSGSYTPVGGETFTILNNDSTDLITGTFAGLPEGATITNFLGSGFNATITYVGGLNNNDVVLTVLAAPSFSIDDVTHLEGNGGPGTTSYTFTITKAGSTSLSTSVDYATVDGSATSPSDFTAITTTNVVFLPADTTKQFTVLVNGDTMVEANEAFTVHLSNVSGRDDQRRGRHGHHYER